MNDDEAVWWTSVMVEQGSTQEIVTPVNEGGSMFVYYNAVPNGGPIALTNAAKRPVAQTPTMRLIFRKTATKNVHNCIQFICK